MGNVGIFVGFKLDWRTPRLCSMRNNNSLIQSPEDIQHLKLKYIYIGSEDKGGVKKAGETIRG